MIDQRHADQLKRLLRHRYPDWEHFQHNAFRTEETEPKRAAAIAGQNRLGPDPLAGLLADWRYDEILAAVEQLGKASSFLWNRVPRRGDLALLYTPGLDRAEFCLQLRQLWHGPEPAPTRIQSFAHYARRQGLPLKWPFVTYFLSLFYPDQEIFIRPQPARWFLRFCGRAEAYDPRPNGATYESIREAAVTLRRLLARYQPQDMIDIQSFIWVCAQEAIGRTGRLPAPDQVALDVPPTQFEPVPGSFPGEKPALREPGPLYQVDSPGASAGQAGSEAPEYSLEAWSEASGFAVAELARWVRAVERKGQIILAGPPGTGKTFLAQGLARHLVGGGDGFSALLQFHPAYTYQEFVQGIRPVEEAGRVSYRWVDGRFLEFCRQAATRSGRCVLILDEINRAPLAQVLGELLFLLEYRSTAVTLASGQSLTIPSNVRLIGTMNTADRSVALVDHALRRRFGVITCPPNFEALRHYHQRTETGCDVEPLIGLLHRLNAQIDDPHYAVGPAYFMRPDLAVELPDIWRMEIEPFVDEFFYDRPERANPFRWSTIAADLGWVSDPP